MFGKTHNEETKIVMSNIKKGIPLSETHKANISKKVYVYSNDNPSILVFEFNSQTETAAYFKSNNATISRYMNSDKLYQNKWRLSSTLLIIPI